MTNEEWRISRATSEPESSAGSSAGSRQEVAQVINLPYRRFSNLQADRTNLHHRVALRHASLTLHNGLQSSAIEYS
jgi:hypothetical protein